MGRLRAACAASVALRSGGMSNAKRWRAAVLAVLAAFTLVLTGCNKSSPTPGTGPTTQQPGGGY
jgi:hypothetical protein